MTAGSCKVGPSRSKFEVRLDSYLRTFTIAYARGFTIAFTIRVTIGNLAVAARRSTIGGNFEIGVHDNEVEVS